MFTVSRFSFLSGEGMGSLGEAVLNWGFLRMGLNRRCSAEDLPDCLRQDVGLAPRAEKPAELRDWHW